MGTLNDLQWGIQITRPEIRSFFEKPSLFGLFRKFEGKFEGLVGIITSQTDFEALTRQKATKVSNVKTSLNRPRYLDPPL